MHYLFLFFGGFNTRFLLYVCTVFIVSKIVSKSKPKQAYSPYFGESVSYSSVENCPMLFEGIFFHLLAMCNEIYSSVDERLPHKPNTNPNMIVKGVHKSPHLI